MINWKPWIIGIWSLAAGTVVFFAGYFLLLLDNPPVHKMNGNLLVGVSIILFIIHYNSGINKFVWKIRANFNDDEHKQLSRIRLSGFVPVVFLLIAIFLPIYSFFTNNLIMWMQSHDSIVIVSSAFAVLGLLVAAFVRFSEFKLLKRSATRSGKT